MKKTVEIPEDLDSKIQHLHESWNQYQGTSYAETVRVLLVLGLDTLEQAGKLNSSGP